MHAMYNYMYLIYVYIRVCTYNIRTTLPTCKYLE